MENDNSTRNVVFSTTWNWASYENEKTSFYRRIFDKEIKLFNFSDTPFIISENFSPFAKKLLDTYLMVTIDYDEINGIEQDKMKKRRKIKNIGFYMLWKTYFDEENIKFSCELWPHRRYQSKTQENCSKKLVIKSKNDFCLLNLGHFGKKFDKENFSDYLKSSKDFLVLFCKVTIYLPKQLSDYIMLKNLYAAPAIYLPPFHREIRIDAFKHTWVLENFQSWFKNEQQEFVVYSDIFYQANEYSDVYFSKQDKEIKLSMALSCQIEDKNNNYNRNNIVNCVHNNTDDNNHEIISENYLKSRKFTLYLYPFTLDDTDVQFILYIFYKNNEKDAWNKSEHKIGGKENMLQNIILLNNNILKKLFFYYKYIKFAIEGHVTRYNRRKLMILHEIKNTKNDWENVLNFKNFELKNLFAKKWVINNCRFMFKFSTTGLPFISLDPVSITFNNEVLKYTLGFYPNGQSEKGFISLILIGPSKIPENLPNNLVLFIKFSLLDSNKNNQNIVNCKHKLEPIISSIELSKFISHNELNNSKYNYLQNEKLTLVIEGQIIDSSKFSESEITSINNVYIRKTCFQKNNPNIIFEKSYFDSKPNVIKFEHKWVLQDIDSLYKIDRQATNCQNDSTKIIFPKIETDFAPKNLQASKNQVQFKLLFYPFGIDKQIDEYITVSLKLNSFCLPETTIQYKFSILDKNGEKHNTKGDIQKFVLKKENTRAIAKFIQIKKLFSVANVHLLSENNLTIYCEGEIFLDESLDQLQLHNYNQLFINTTYPAVDLISISTSELNKNLKKNAESSEQILKYLKENFFNNLVINDIKIDNFNNEDYTNSIVSKNSNLKSRGFNVLMDADEMVERKQKPKTKKEKKREKKEIEKQKKQRESVELTSSSDEDSEEDKKKKTSKNFKDKLLEIGKILVKD